MPEEAKLATATCHRRYTLIPTRLPSDSRVPKSSSIPARLNFMGRSFCDFEYDSVSSADCAVKSRSLDTGLCYYSANLAKKTEFNLSDRDREAMVASNTATTDISSADDNVAPFWGNPALYKLRKDIGAGVRLVGAESDMSISDSPPPMDWEQDEEEMCENVLSSSAPETGMKTVNGRLDTKRYYSPYIIIIYQLTFA